MTHFDIKGGDWPSAAGAPAPQITADVRPRSAAFLGQDMPDMRPKFERSEGDSVTCGQVVFRDRKHPEIAFVSPLSGVVSQWSYGARRTLSLCVIDARDGEDPQVQHAVPPQTLDTAATRDVLLARGMWPAFRTRPFGRMPAPQAVPAAIFVNAKPASPLAPGPKIVLAGQADAFRTGVSVLTRLTEGVVHICQPKGAPLCPEMARVRTATFSGSYAAGLTGTHIDLLHPASLDQQVWSIGYQDVVAIGHLFETGRYMPDRVVALAGPAATEPRLLRTVLGAHMADITGAAQAEALSGDPLCGRAARYLGRFHDQITLMDGAARAKTPAWLARIFGTGGALVPTRGLEHALGVDILPVPLMRALSVGDSEAARRLGCLALVEEDVAALSRLCTSSADYGALLRQVLDELREEAA